MSTPQFGAFRRWVLTGSIAAVTATGAWYGAGLKVKQEFNQEKKKALEATPLQQIEELETYRANLVLKKQMLDKKIDELELKEKREKRRLLRELEKRGRGEEGK